MLGYLVFSLPYKDFNTTKNHKQLRLITEVPACQEVVINYSKG